MYNTGRASYCFAACQDCVAELEREARKENLVATLRCFPEKEPLADTRGIRRDEGGGGGGRRRRDEQLGLFFSAHTVPWFRLQDELASLFGQVLINSV